MGEFALLGFQMPSNPVQTLVLPTALTLLPAFLMALTPFLRITIVLHFLRQALGTQTVPSNQVLLGLALTMTLILIQPKLGAVQEMALQPMLRSEIPYQVAWERAEPALKGYLLHFCREKDLAVFARAQGIRSAQSPESLPFLVVASAYAISEMRAGFQIGAAVYLPFLVIDVVVASITLAVGMVQLPPVMISSPLKILLFVAVDGWNLLIGSLLRSFE